MISFDDVATAVGIFTGTLFGGLGVVPVTV
jgi:hypothetical protein